MSSYDGIATLESWLENEVFYFKLEPEEIVLFESFREHVENNIENYLETDDGYGNNKSWRGWGRGYGSFSEDQLTEFEKLCNTILLTRVRQ